MIYITSNKYLINMIIYITIYNSNYSYNRYNIYIIFTTYIHICIQNVIYKRQMEYL